MPDISRRDFLRTTPALFLAPTLFCRTAFVPVRIALVYSPEYLAVKRGAEVAAAEAQRAAGLLKRDFFFASMTRDEFAGAEGWTGIITATPGRPIRAPSAIPIVDVTGRAPCAGSMLQLRSGSGDCPAGARCVLWHHSLERFGAGQLNARFAAAGIGSITEQTWLGWFALKLLWESATRGRSPTELSYDGHKGVPLRFGGALLVQPVYVLSADGSTVIREIQPPFRIESVTCL